MVFHEHCHRVCVCVDVDAWRMCFIECCEWVKWIEYRTGVGLCIHTIMNIKITARGWMIFATITCTYYLNLIVCI